MPLYLVGMDEAGYGPMLGPLVVSAVIFEAPESLNKRKQAVDLWKILPTTSPFPKQYEGTAVKIPVCDSKKIYQPQKGIGMLERSVLAFARLLPDDPFAGYSDLFLPLKARIDRIEKLSAGLKDELNRKGIRFCEACIRVVDVPEFNKGVTAHQNKSDFLFRIVAEILKHIYSKYADKGYLRIAVGKQGGRTYYRPHLSKAFPDCNIMTIKQHHNQSCYRLSPNNQPNLRNLPADLPAKTLAQAGASAKAGQHTIKFLKDGEDADFCIALASMFGKYTRELEMIKFNRMFNQYFPAVKPTAGYPTDAKRFINEIKPFCKDVGLEMNNFIRIK